MPRFSFHIVERYVLNIRATTKQEAEKRFEELCCAPSVVWNALKPDETDLDYEVSEDEARL